MSSVNPVAVKCRNSAAAVSNRIRRFTKVGPSLARVSRAACCNPCLWLPHSLESKFKHSARACCIARLASSCKGGTPVRPPAASTVLTALSRSSPEWKMNF
eukprot:9121017-Prorocentrum_lima.AAC.1